MGHIKHKAIIVTSWSVDLLETARVMAGGLGLSVSSAVNSSMNGYVSILVASDGSKQGWEEASAGDLRRSHFTDWLKSIRFADGSSPMEWCEVAYGSDDRKAEIVDSEWTRTESGITS